MELCIPIESPCINVPENIVFHLYMNYLKNIDILLFLIKKIEKFIQENIIFIFFSFQLYIMVFLLLICEMYKQFTFLWHYNFPK